MIWQKRNWAVGGLQSVKDEIDVIIKSHLEKHYPQWIRLPAKNLMW